MEVATPGITQPEVAEPKQPVSFSGTLSSVLPLSVTLDGKGDAALLVFLEMLAELKP